MLYINSTTSTDATLNIINFGVTPYVKISAGVGVVESADSQADWPHLNCLPR
jgi:hypothetical protein